MITKVDPHKINYYIWHQGPYIVFYNDIEDEINRKIVNFIYENDAKCRKLNIFEIYWKDQLKYNFLSNKQILNTIKLYAFGKIFLQKFNPNENEIKDLFYHAVNIHNENTYSKAKNVGKRIIKNLVNTKFESKKIKDKVLKKCRSRIESNRKLILYDIIAEPNTIYSHTGGNVKYKLPSILKNDVNVNMANKQVVLNSPTRLELFKKVDRARRSNSSLLNNFKVKDLSSEIMFEKRVRNMTPKNEIKNDYFLKTDNNLLTFKNTEIMNNHNNILVKFPDKIPLQNYNQYSYSTYDYTHSWENQNPHI